MLIVKDGAAKVRSDTNQARVAVGRLTCVVGGTACVQGQTFARISLTACEQQALGLTPGWHGVVMQEGGEARHSILQIPHPRHGEKTCFFLAGDQGQSEIRHEVLDEGSSARYREPAGRRASADCLCQVLSRPST
jgi:hypothetical protein